jgi:DNA-binding GntR family transcriptional regulator
VGVDNEGGAETNDESKALSQFVYERLREGIISGRYAAGEPLRERDIASEFNVSRIPIRTALPRLEVGGFVRVLPRRTAVVTHITSREVGELYDLRAVLEPLIARTAAERVSNGADSDDVERALAAAAEALHHSDFAELDRLNTALHASIVELADTRLLNKTFAPLQDRIDRLSGVTIASDPVTRHSEHAALVDAIVSGHAELAAATAYTHTERGRSRTLAVLPEHPHYAAE